MTTLTAKNFTALVSQWAAVVQSSVAAVKPTLVLSFTKGTILRAFAEAQASVSLWLQGLILKLLTVTRLATSEAGDVDSFVADFGLTRLPASASTGLATFARVTPTNAATVPVGAFVQTADGSQTFVVVADPTNAAWSPTANNGAGGYIIPASTVSLQAPVQNTVPGSAGNVQAGVVTILQTGISGVDTVTNANPFAGGIDAETDAALKARFLAFFSSLSNSTPAAIAFAITSTNQQLQVTILEQPLSAPAVKIWVDDGSGSIAGPLVTAATNAANSVRAAGITYGVFAAAKLTANVNMTIATASGFVHATVVGQVALAITAYINGLGMSVTGPNLLSYMALGSVAFGVLGVTDVTNVTLNGGTSDLTGTAGQTIKSGTIAVS